MKKLIILALTLGFTTASFATMNDLKKFKAQYPNAKNIGKCAACHAEGPNKPLNSYGEDYLREKNLFTDALAKMDSDKDGIDNITEINADTFPGDPNSHTAY
jgi:hypothetical protein